MKYKFLLILAILIAAQGFLSCKKSGSPIEGENFDYDASYALGMNIGASMGQDGIIPNIDGLIQGIKDQLSGGETKFDEGEARMIIQEAYTAVMEKQEADYYAMMEELGAEAKQKGMEFLAENSGKPGVMITASGLQYEIISEVNGQKPTADNVVRVHYEGRLIDGTVFDSSYDRGVPAEFPLGRVIPGWTEGVQLMGVGSKYKFYIPSELGYGPGGQGNIPPFSTLIFEVELLDIIN